MPAANSRTLESLVAVVCAGLSLAIARPAVAQSDNCSTATLITVPGSYSGTTVGANNDGSASCGASSTSPDVWFRVAPTETRGLVVTTCGGATWDTVLSVHSGCPGNAGNEVVCNDDSCGLQSQVLGTVNAGTNYYIRVAGYGGSTGAFTITVAYQAPPPPPSVGADVVYSDVGGITHYGPVGTIHAYALGTSTCNIGNQNLQWGNTWGGTPVMAMNAYRLFDGRLEQIGLGFVKRACCAGAGSGCGIPCNGVGGSYLGTGCRDSYSSGYNGSFSQLAPRSAVNAFNGTMSLGGALSGDAIYRRLQIQQSDLTAANFPGALYFVEGEYVGTDDAAAGNGLNNASYKRATVDAAFNMTEQGVIQMGTPAIQAWHDHGLGLNMPDPSVQMFTANVPGEGRFHVAVKTRNLGNGQWRYDYAVFNLNSDRSGGSFSVPVPAGVAVSGVGFHDVPFHSGEPYDNTDWTSSVASGAVTWRSPQTFAQNANSNALRWGTMYNFWFDASTAPANGLVTLGLFKPNTPQSIQIAAGVPGALPCPADFNHDGTLNSQDFFDFLTAFFAGSADFNQDGVTNSQDFFDFLTSFFAGCP